jgi:hypothetical protein
MRSLSKVPPDEECGFFAISALPGGRLDLRKIHAPIGYAKMHDKIFVYMSNGTSSEADGSFHPYPPYL